MRRLAGNLFIERRGWVEVVTVAATVGVFVWRATGKHFAAALPGSERSALFSSLAGTSGALLGFVLAALAILVALPNTDRLEVLRKHHSWPRVPSSYVRAAVALLAALVLCTLGIALDGHHDPLVPYEAVSIAVLVFTFVQVITAVVALDQVIAVARVREPLGPAPIDDPGL